MLRVLRRGLLPHATIFQSHVKLHHPNCTTWTRIMAARYLHVSDNSANRQSNESQPSGQSRTAKQPKRRQQNQKPTPQQHRQRQASPQQQSAHAAAEPTPVVWSWSDKAQRSQLLLRRLHSIADPARRARDQTTAPSAFPPHHANDTTSSDTAQLLTALLGLAGGNHLTMSWHDWSAILHTLQQERLHHLALPFYAVLRHQHSVLIEQHRAKQAHEPTSTTSSSSSSSSSSTIPPDLRMPSKSVTLMIECVIHSTRPVASLATSMPSEVQSAVSALFNGRGSPPPPSSCGVELAEWLLRDLRSPSTLDHFHWSAGPWAAVLRALAQQVEQAGSPRRQKQIGRVRAFYHSIPVHSTATRNIMLTLADNSAAARSQPIRGVSSSAATATASAGLDADPLQGVTPDDSRVSDSRSAGQPSRTQKDMLNLLLQLANKGAWKGAERLVAKAQSAGVQLNVQTATAWLACHERSGEWRGVAKVWQRMAELGLAPDATSYRTLIQICTVNGEAEQLAKIEPIYAEMTSGSGLAGKPLHFSAHDFERLIKTAHRWRLAAEARKWAERAKVAGLWDQLDEVSRRIMARVAEWEQQPRLTAQGEQQMRLMNRLTALADAGDWQQAELAVADFEAAGGRLDVQSATVWLACYERTDEWRGAKKVWQRMAKLGIAPSAVSYCKLMQIHMSSGEAEQLAKVEALYEEMQSGSGPAGQPLHFSVRNFERLIKTAHRCRLTDEARKWGERARAAGLWEQLDESSQRILTAAAKRAHRPRPAALLKQKDVLRNRLLDLTHQGDWKEAERLVAKAEANGVPLDTWTLNAWLSCYNHSGEWRGAEKVWRRMAELGVAPDSISYSNLMQVYMSCGEAEQLAKIEPIYAEMSSGSGPAGQPLHFSVHDFQQLIKTARGCRLVAEVRKWSERAKEAGLWDQLDDVSRHILITVAEWEHQPRLTAQEEQQMRLMNRLTALAGAGDWQQAELAVAVFEAAGGQLNVQTATAWLACHERSGEWRGVAKVWQRMAELGLAPDATSYRTLIQICTVNGEAEQLAKIEPIYAEMTSGSGLAGKPLHFSARDFERLIKAAHRCRLADEVDKWAERANEAGLWDQLDELSRLIVANMNRFMKERAW